MKPKPSFFATVCRNLRSYGYGVLFGHDYILQLDIQTRKLAFDKDCAGMDDAEELVKVLNNGSPLLRDTKRLADRISE